LNIYLHNVAVVHNVLSNLNFKFNMFVPYYYAVTTWLW